MWYITHVNCMQANQSKRFINLRLTPHNVKSFNDNSHYSLQFQIDTWLHNVICLRDLQHLLQDGNPVLMLSKAILKLYKGTIIKPKGECDLKADNKGHIYTLRFQVMEPSHIPLLSVETCQKLNLLPINTNHVIHNIDTKEVSGASHAMDEIISVYDDVFDRLGCLPGELHLEIDPTVQPVQLLARRIPIAIKSKIIKAIQEMEQKGVMAKVVELTPWIINMVVTEKKNDKLRICIHFTPLCIDPTPLNKALLRSHFQIPTIEEIIPEITNAKIFIVLDAKDVHWQIKLDEASSYLTTDWRPEGRYRCRSE